MSKKANPTFVGSFVLGAILLMIAAVVIFGSGSLFQQRPRAVAFFEGDIQGLSAGAPVNLDGVRIGTVTDIRIDLNVATMSPVIPVYMEFNPKLLNITGLSKSEVQNGTVLRSAIAHGLHARLASQSFVTGQLLVDLSLDPNEPSRTLGADPTTVEIPTTLSDLQKLKEFLGKIPADEIANELLKTLASVDKLVSSPQIASILRSLAEASDNLDGLTESTKQGLPRLIESLTGTSSAANQTLRGADQFLNGDLRSALVAAKAALEHANTLLSDATSLISESSSQRYDIDQILRNLAATSQSLRGFTNEIDRRPNAIILGK